MSNKIGENEFCKHYKVTSGKRLVFSDSDLPTVIILFCDVGDAPFDKVVKNTRHWLTLYTQIPEKRQLNHKLKDRSRNITLVI